MVNVNYSTAILNAYKFFSDTLAIVKSFATHLEYNLDLSLKGFFQPRRRKSIIYKILRDFNLIRYIVVVVGDKENNLIIATG